MSIRVLKKTKLNNLPTCMFPDPKDMGTITLDFIDSLCEKEYATEMNRIIVIVLARYDLDEVKAIVRKNYNYWHELTGENLDFFWLGYNAYNTPSDLHGENAEDLAKTLIFDNRSFVKDVNRLERLANYSFGDEIGLILLDCRAGSVQYEKSLYLNIESLAHKVVDTKLKKFFLYLIKTCSQKQRVEEVKTELKTKKLVYSLEDIKISDILNLAGPGTGLIGSFRLS